MQYIVNYLPLTDKSIVQLRYAVICPHQQALHAYMSWLPPQLTLHNVWGYSGPLSTLKLHHSTAHLAWSVGMILSGGNTSTGILWVRNNRAIKCFGGGTIVWCSIYSYSAADVLSWWAIHAAQYSTQDAVNVIITIMLVLFWGQNCCKMYNERVVRVSVPYTRHEGIHHHTNQNEPPSGINAL